MTTVQLLLIASMLGAIVFFVAGASLGALRRPAAPPLQLESLPPPPPLVDHARVAELERALADAHATATQLRESAGKSARQLDEARTDSVAATTELELVQRRLRDAERALADKTRAVHDLATEAEVMKGRLRDADAQRADYVRLRTSAAEADYLKREVARLEKELRAVRADALAVRGVPRPRARGSSSIPPLTGRPIGESLTSVIERFATAGTRCVAVADHQGFPLASNGSDGVALAAYAALVLEAAGRASEYLPVGAPAVVEIVDERGVRIAVWSLEVESERLMLAHLAVSAVDNARLETTLGELGKILAPARREERPST
jgi:predicted  nucleic acid-binding Zn-ribbon protein